MYLDKSGLKALWDKIKTMFANIKTDLDNTKTDLADTKTDLASTKGRLSGINEHLSAFEDRVNHYLPIQSGVRTFSGKVIVQGYITNQRKTLVIQIPGCLKFESMKNINILNAADVNLYCGYLYLDDVIDLVVEDPQISISLCANGLEIIFKYEFEITSVALPSGQSVYPIIGTIDNFKAIITY